ncbi:ABC transporter substrate-binding protein [Pseudomonas sp. dw_358]|uniref:ABC transporter substrate-binding protein n=1 Tax=Pseudomonas sp. dw_358 TaxID=2720083 RepID=UPI0021169BF0|nr:ABC transporter substrate-binding protein [Pseudomonas sp. dw_358]
MAIFFSGPQAWRALSAQIRTTGAVIGLGAAFWMAAGTALADTPIKLVMSWKYEGPQAFYYLAQDKGYFKAEGLDVTIDQGEGSSASVPKVAAGAYDAGVGDTSALIQMAAREPAQAPKAVFMMFNTPPFVIAVKADSPIKTPKDLEGKTVGAPAGDGALKLFPALAKQTGIDLSKVNITNMAPNLREQLLMRGQVDAVFGYLTTITFSAKAMGIDPDKQLRFIRYGDYGMDLYSNTIFFSQPFIKAHPEAVRGFLAALDKAIKDVVADPDAGIDAVMKREPLLKRDVELAKLKTSIAVDMSHPEIARIGLGDVDEERLKKNIAVVVETNALPATPSPDAVFDRRFLPPRDTRLSSL